MEIKLFVKWLKEKELLNTIIAYYPFFENIFINNLNLNNFKNQIVVISDLGKEGFRIPALISACYIFAAKSLGYETIFVHWKNIKKRNEPEIVQRLLNVNDKSVFIISSSTKMSPFKLINRTLRKHSQIKGHKFLTMTNLSQLRNELFPSLVHSMNADPKKMHNMGLKLKNKIDKAKIVQIKTSKGTNLIINKENVKSIINSGLYLNYGQGGNLPAGEVYFHPNGLNNVNGIVYIDGSIKTNKGTFLVRGKVKLTIENGLIIKIEGSNEAKLLAKTLEDHISKAINPEHIKRISEIGIGINPNARIIGPTIINEKTFKTAHIANGSNHWFNGPIITNIHLDHVFRDPEIYLDGDKFIY
jgi:leucyl aminopeptidase (aminopeptidase T)